MDISDDIQTELLEVKEEIKNVEGQIQVLLEHQQCLLQRKSDLEFQLKDNARQQTHDDKWEAKGKTCFNTL